MAAYYIYRILSAKGFTLIELMIAMAVMAIMAAIAIPSYQGYIQKVRRSDAVTLLMEAAGRQEKFYYRNNSYTTSLTTLYSDLKEEDRGKSPEDYYQLSISDDPADNIQRTYTLTATPVATEAQAKDTKCTTFTLTSRGVKGMTGSGTVDECW